MSLAGIVNVTITAESQGVTRAGFGTPMILSANASFAERARTYTSLAGLVTDGFATTDPEYLAAQALLSQSPRPTSFKIGRLANKPTQSYQIEVSSVQDSTKYVVFLADGTEVSFTSDSDATNDEIAAGLAAAIDAAQSTHTAGTSGSAGSLVIDVDGDAAGNWLSLQVADTSLLSIKQDHSDPGVAADLAAIALYDDDWFALVNLYNSELMVAAIAGYVETAERFFMAASNATEIITEASVSATDVAEDMKDASRSRTHVFYHSNPAVFADAASLGKNLPKDPGSITWENKTLSGVTPDSLTPTHVVNLKAKNAGYYQTISGHNGHRNAKVAAGEWIDTIRGRSWFKARIQERIANAIFTNDKVPYTNDGIGLLEAEIRAQIIEGQRNGYIADDPEPTVSAPDAADISPAEKAARNLPDMEATFTEAGAIHTAAVNVQVSL